MRKERRRPMARCLGKPAGMKRLPLRRLKVRLRSLEREGRRSGLHSRGRPCRLKEHRPHVLQGPAEALLVWSVRAEPVGIRP